ncbi:MAG: sugar ABC transporter permease [Ruminococcus sp.]|jgi:multiple sugar transport system permease protein|nr:sugar ABC transporter permease [Ruminococcus sp.]
MAVNARSGAITYSGSGSSVVARPHRHKSISYEKWGYFFIAPFFIVYAVASLYPLIMTFIYGFFERYQVLGQDMHNEFIGLDNFRQLFSSPDVARFAGNTFIIWVVGFIPQIFISLILASWFTDLRLKLHATGFFKVVIYLPNVIMAAAMSFLFWALFGDTGPINQMIAERTGSIFQFMVSIPATRLIISGINFLMWFGNTSIMLMAAINGIDTSLYEAASIDGANSSQTFWRITMPLIRPILLYVIVTSLIGGLQMFDIPNIMTRGAGGTDRTSMTLVMYLNNFLSGTRDYGMAGALSIILFVVGGVLSLIVFYGMRDKDAVKADKQKRKLIRDRKRGI